MSPTPADVPTVDGMPQLGFGTWQNDDHDQCVTSVKTALELGYRHIDTAQIYRNEAAVGEGIAESSVAREDIFLATKIWITNLAADDVVSTAAESLERLGTEYLDLLYVHWAAGEYDAEETLAAFEQLHEEGKIKRIGVSNFEPKHLDRAQEVLDVPIFANQIELHPFLRQEALREYAADADINLVAYSPLARGNVIDDPVIGEIAEKHGVSEPQVSLAWLRAKGVTAIPKATSEAHIRDNWESLSLELDEEDIDQIDARDRHLRTVNPDFGPDSWE